MHNHYRRTTDISEEAKVRLPNGMVMKAEGVQGWLEVWMDRKLSFKHHIKTKTAAARSAFMTIARMANTEKVLSQKSLRQLYISCVTIGSDFGAEVWWKNQ